ncbi:hypothetical protein Trydic_g8168 [Trypoxylus dichotomus]
MKHNGEASFVIDVHGVILWSKTAHGETQQSAVTHSSLSHTVNYGALIDSTSQFDAIRAYLKELDITSGVWIGLQKNSDKPNFTWTDFRPLSSDNHWQEAIPVGSDPLCVAMDPAADFRWHALPCGGPAIASFICELPVPSWATGTGGCLLTELPSLTVLYIPEQSALELTSDCGLDGTKRIACKGNANRDEMIKQLACTINHDDFEDRPTKSPSITTTTTPDTTYTSTSHQTTPIIKTTRPWIWTNTVDTGEYSSPTRHRRETENTMNPLSTQSIPDIASTKPTSMIQKETVKVGTQTTPKYLNIEAITSAAITAISDRILARQQENKVHSIGNESAVVEVSESPDEQGDFTATLETKASEPSADGEYPSAINQGQLFSIIENGTVFDIVEMNETGTEENKVKETTTAPHVRLEIQFGSSDTPAIATRNTEFLYTTVMYNKEPTEEASPVTNEALRKSEQQKAAFKDYRSPKTPNDLSTKRDDKTLSKEIEMLPPGASVNSMTKLNRTNRKELPMMEDFDDSNDEIDLDIDNKLPYDKAYTRHQTVEIKLHSDQNKTKSVLFVTTRVNERNKRVKETKNVQTQTEINKITSTENPTTLQKLDVTTTDSPIKALKEKFLPKALLHETQIVSSKKPDAESLESEIENFENTGGPLYSEPQAQPRPNRQRQLTRPQRKSFYPYFFSRMLG